MPISRRDSPFVTFCLWVHSIIILATHTRDFFLIKNYYYQWPVSFLTMLAVCEDGNERLSHWFCNCACCVVRIYIYLYLDIVKRTCLLKLIYANRSKANSLSDALSLSLVVLPIKLCGSRCLFFALQGRHRVLSLIKRADRPHSLNAAGAFSCQNCCLFCRCPCTRWSQITTLTRFTWVKNPNPLSKYQFSNYAPICFLAGLAACFLNRG